jgi:hypothetical protein
MELGERIGLLDDPCATTREVWTGLR